MDYLECTVFTFFYHDFLYCDLQFTSEEFTLRSKSVHERHVLKLNGPLCDTISTTYGVSNDSILNSLEYFHVSSGLPPDIMHDILEGVAVVELKCLLTFLSQDLHLFNLATLNNRIKCFPYGYFDSRNKPLPFPSNFFSASSISLKQSCMLL